MCGYYRYLLHTYKGKKEDLNLKVITTTDPITGQFKIAEYNDKCETTTTNSVENMWLTKYNWPTEIIYD